MIQLNAMLASWIGTTVGLPFDNLRITASTTLSPRGPSQRLLCESSSPITITMPRGGLAIAVPSGMLVEVVDVTRNASTYPITINGNGWRVNGATTPYQISTNGGSATFLYRSDAGDFRLVANLGAADLLPYPARFDEGIALCLAETLQGEYGQALFPADINRARLCRRNLRALYSPTPNAVFDQGAVLIGGALFSSDLGNATDINANYDGDYGG